jgi:penicillin amidase
VEDFKSLQNNNFNLKASELLPNIFEHMDATGLTSEEKEIYAQIKAWDFYSEIDQLAPSIWDLWWEKLYDQVWDEFENDDLALDTPFIYQTIYLLKNNPEDQFMDIVSTPETETAKDLFLITFKASAKELLDWKAKNGNYNWSEYKGTFTGHLLQALPAFSRFDIPIGGDYNTVNAASKNHGPSWRMIVEMSTPPRALGIYPGGQSGNPGSKYYDNFIDDWAAGNYHELLFMQDNTTNSQIMATQTLTPKK